MSLTKRAKLVCEKFVYELLSRFHYLFVGRELTPKGFNVLVMNFRANRLQNKKKTIKFYRLSTHCL